MSILFAVVAVERRDQRTRCDRMVHHGKAPARVGGVDLPMHAKCSEDVTGAGVGIERDHPSRWAGSGGERLAGGHNDVVD